ncbi:hypothetical protein [uncultured Gilvimarinus sp.]|uniref:hypothetical protein n=1 Tax=uncultured Gilvimarinus sp. TaxID=1689143 RepID=UPI0030EB7A26|tara:strand:+ start:6360 stop:7211 length:852 start_codon:yes stop_codon:yes gene_type:complete
MDQLFSNREIAVSVWILIFFSLAFTKKEVRSSAKAVVLGFCNSKILSLFILMGAYTYFIVDFLSGVGIWSLDQLKNTILWFVFVASTELFKANKIHSEDGYFRGSIKGHFKLLTVFEFIVAFHCFSLIAEIIIVPVTSVLVMLLAYSEIKEEYKPVERVMNFILSAFGVFLLIYGAYFISTNFGDFAKHKTMMDFVIPIILSTLLLPFIYVVSIFQLYEQILVRVNIYTDDRFYRLYAKVKALIHFNRDHKNLNSWLAYACASDFESRKSINESIFSYHKREL